ncbi:heterokaryon incompatibility protein-domain-containing protein [Paraphoma chrysanthemicola]|nr:heterokaryon incompatibility protein-domain-containing protein [Paraphoma chrysanthemicola]
MREYRHIYFIFHGDRGDSASYFLFFIRRKPKLVSTSRHRLPLPHLVQWIDDYIAPMPCQHSDIRKLDGLRCCLSCGEAICEDLPESEQEYHICSNVPYRYRRLSYELGQEIRLVVLYAGQKQDRLVCTIIHVNLLDEPQYEALSYTWKDHTGDASFTGELYCRGTAIPITANCEAALRQFRKRDAPRYLWIDAICIDQKNEEEKSHQVQVMSKIYSMASQVLAFIGPGDRQQRKSFHRVIKHLRGEPQPLIFSQYGARDSDLRTFLKMSYWGRVWVIQEIALARRVTVVLGDESVHWMAHEVDAMLQLCREEDQILPGVLAWKPEIVGGEQDLLEALHKSRTCAATDPRDKVFALLGIVQKQFSAAIPVDYSMNTLDLFTKVAILYIQNMKSLQILKYTLGQDVAPYGLPSWAPDWAAPIQVELLPAMFNPKQIQKFASTWYETPLPQRSSFGNPELPERFLESYLNITVDRVEFAIHEKQGSGSWIHEKEASPSSFYLRRLTSTAFGLVVRAHYLDTLLPSLPGGKKRAFGHKNLCESCPPDMPRQNRVATDQNYHVSCQNLGSDEIGKQQKLFELRCSKARARLERFETAYSKGFIRQTALFNSKTVIDSFLFFGGFPRDGENTYEVWLLATSDVPFLLRRVNDHYKLIGTPFTSLA